MGSRRMASHFIFGIIYSIPKKISHTHFIHVKYSEYKSSLFSLLTRSTAPLSLSPTISPLSHPPPCQPRFTPHPGAAPFCRQ